MPKPLTTPTREQLIARRTALMATVEAEREENKKNGVKHLSQASIKILDKVWGLDDWIMSLTDPALRNNERMPIKHGKATLIVMVKPVRNAKQKASGKSLCRGVVWAYIEGHSYPNISRCPEHRETMQEAMADAIALRKWLIEREEAKQTAAK